MAKPTTIRQARKKTKRRSERRADGPNGENQRQHNQDFLATKRVAESPSDQSSNNGPDQNGAHRYFRELAAEVKVWCDIENSSGDNASVVAKE